MSEGPGPAGPTRVTHVVISLDVGGLERIVLDLVRRGRDLGQDVAVVCLERPGTLASQVEAAGASVWCVHKPPGRRPETMGKLREVFARIRPDVIHSHQIGALIYAGPAAKRAGRPVVVHTEHINHAAKRTGVADRVKIRLLWGLAGRYAARFFCVSEDIVEAVAAFGVVPGASSRSSATGSTRPRSPRRTLPAPRRSKSSTPWACRRIPRLSGV